MLTPSKVAKKNIDFNIEVISASTKTANSVIIDRGETNAVIVAANQAQGELVKYNIST